MHLIGCDFHTRFQQMAMMDCQTGEIIERRLDHQAGEAQKFYAALPGPARIGMEATGRTQWFERLLAEQGHELWVGDAAQIRAGVVRKQKIDRRLLQQVAVTGMLYWLRSLLSSAIQSLRYQRLMASTCSCNSLPGVGPEVLPQSIVVGKILTSPCGMPA